MSLHPGVGIVVEDHQQARHDFVVKLFLKSRGKVGRHLSDCVARGVTHSWMLKENYKISLAPKNSI